MFIANYVELIERNETVLQESLLKVATRHQLEPDIRETCMKLAAWSGVHLSDLHPIRDRFADTAKDEPERVEKGLFRGARKGGLGLLRDLHDLYILATEVKLTYEILKQASEALRDKELLAFCDSSMKETVRQLNWIETRIRQAAPQVLVAA
ncbi:MAG TPA: molybdopterin oxidoreductase [Bacteroidota bacterium]|nr:molybdopterin oxidoreductase [Bacteroidota bacterium]